MEITYQKNYKNRVVNFQKLGVDTHMTLKMHIFHKDYQNFSLTFKKNHTNLIFFKNSYPQNLLYDL